MDHNNEAVVYSQNMNFQKEDGTKLIEELMSKYLHVAGDSDELTVLDLGCGTGYLSNLIAEKLGDNGKIIGVDPNSERIKIAKELYGNNKNVEFIIADDQTFPEGEYDAVYCGDVIHWIENKQPTFKRIYDNLKPGGYFAFTSYDNVEYFPVFGEVFDAFGPQMYNNTWGLLYWESVDSFSLLAQSEGFEIVRMKVKNRPLPFSSIDSVIDFMYGVFYGVFDRTSPKLDGVRRKYAGQTITVTMPRLSAVFKKLNN
jgi:ubiquinone/menaquinone biosynthesis C-methylase UbiE